MSWHHPSAVLAYVTVAFVLGMWLGSRGKVQDWRDGYQSGREDEANGQSRDQDARA